MIHFRTWTVVLVISVMALFYWLERRGLSFESALRAGRLWIAGPKRPRSLLAQKQRWLDFG